MADNQVTLEPVAWLYERNGVRVLKEQRSEAHTSPAMGFSETPLYSTPPALIADEVERVARALSEASDCPRESGQTVAGAWWWDSRYDSPVNVFAHEARESDLKQARAALAAMDRAPGVKWLCLTCDGLGKDGITGSKCSRCDGMGHTVEQPPQPAPRPVEAGEVTQISVDVAELVIAARELVFSDHRPVGSPETQAEVELIELFDSLDKATEAFSERIPWHDEPETETRHRHQSLSAARAEIEGLREALEGVARELQVERDQLFECCTVAGHPETLDEGAKPDITRMDAALCKARAALSTDQGEG